MCANIFKLLVKLNYFLCMGIPCLISKIGFHSVANDAVKLAVCMIGGLCTWVGLAEC